MNEELKNSQLNLHDFLFVNVRQQENKRQSKSNDVPLTIKKIRGKKLKNLLNQNFYCIYSQNIWRFKVVLR